MRRTKEGIQVLTALEKAEFELAEAIEMAKIEANKAKRAEQSKQKAMEPFLPRNRQEESKSQDKSQEKYSYIHMDENGLPKSKQDDFIDSVKEELNTSKQLNDIEIDKEDVRSLYNVSLDDAGFRDKSILNQSKDYEMESFNEIDLVSGIMPEPDEIMPSSFLLESFEEDEAYIEPYELNAALLLGKDFSPEEENKPQSVADMLDRAQAEAEAELSTDADFAVQNGELRNKGLLIVQQAKKEANDILDNASAEALQIRKNAEEEATRLIQERVRVAEAAAAEKGYQTGFEKGQNEGLLDAVQATNVQMIEEAKLFREELNLSLQEFEDRKNQLFSDSLNDLTNLAMVAAEKIVKISLKSSKDIISKIIVAAAEDCRNKDWAKVYISHDDKALTLNLEKGLIDALRQISPNIKVVVMEDEPTGTCIIETPDQIIDASVDVQLDTIKQIVNDNEL